MIAYYKTEVPFLRLLLFFIGGISISILFNFAPQNFWLFIWVFLFIALLGFAFSYKDQKVYLHSHFIGILIYLQMMISGIILCNQHKQIYWKSHFSNQPADELIITIDEEPRIKGDIARFDANVKGSISNRVYNQAEGKLLLAMRFDTTKSLNLNYGDELLIKAKYEATEQPYNPAEFNYKRYLSFQQIYHQTFINQKQVAKIDSNKGNFIKAFALKFRIQQVKKFKNFLPDKEAQAVASTLILGYRTDLSKDILNAYSKTGTMHVLSVSGMHVAIVVLLLDFLLSFMNKKTKWRIIKSILMISLIWFYALLAGLAPSVERAAIMLTFILVAKAFNKRINIFNIIAIAAYIILINNPFSLTNVGFQLSFIAVCGLIYLQPKISRLYQPKNRVLQFCWTCISVSIAAQLSTAPISLYYFHQFPVYFVISNLFITLPAILIMYAGISFLLLSFVTPLVKVLGIILNGLIGFTNKGLILIEQLHYANITQIWMSFNEIILFYLILILTLKSVREKRYLKFAIIAFSFLIIGKTYSHFKSLRQKQVTFFSLRKNTAIAFINGRNAFLITDLNPDEYTYLFSVKPYLDSCQINQIQYYDPHQNKSEKLFTFEDYKLKIIHQEEENKGLDKIDWLMLSGDQIYDLTNILHQNKYNELFIDGKNRDFVIKNMKKQLTKHKSNVHVLKRNLAVELKIPKK